MDQRLASPDRDGPIALARAPLAPVAPAPAPLDRMRRGIEEKEILIREYGDALLLRRSTSGAEPELVQ